jgi:hypothetical protein
MYESKSAIIRLPFVASEAKEGAIRGKIFALIRVHSRLKNGNGCRQSHIHCPLHIFRIAITSKMKRADSFISKTWLRPLCFIVH